MSTIKILFQGDSITDGGRDYRNYHDMGPGYPKYAVKLIAEQNPEHEFEFINLGISGNRTDQLFDRLYNDAISLKPDIISILIGVNDIWHRHSHNIKTTDAQIELNYRCILERIKNETNAKIMILSPYILGNTDKDAIKKDLETVIPMVRSLAEEYADVFVPLDKYFAEAEKTVPFMFFSADGVHPNQNGAEFIGKHYAEAIKPLLEKF